MKFTFLSIFILTLMMTTARAQSGDAVQANATILTTAKITGAWRVNYAESDDAFEKMQAMTQNKSSAVRTEKTNQKTDELPAMSVSIFPPETIVLVENDDEKSITINENFSQIVYTRTVLTDGIKRFGEIQNGANFAIAAARKDNALKIETESPRGNRMIENYSIAADGKKLVIIVRFEDTAAKEILTLRRVYDKISPDIFPSETEEMQ